ncbi:hypothetical protein ACFFRR_000060 [Megaselia abdita]
MSSASANNLKSQGDDNEVDDIEAYDQDDDENFDYLTHPDLPPPPDGGYGWVICFASFMCNMMVDGIAYTFGIFLDKLVEHFGEGKGKVSWVGSLLCGVYLSAGPIVSALVNKYGCRAICIAGSIIACIAFILSTFSQTVNALMVIYGVIGGFGFGMIYLPAVVAVGYYFETKRSLATGIAVCGSGVGTFAFAPLATYLLENYDWKNAFIIFAGLILNCAIFGAMMRPLKYPKESKQKPLMQRMYEEKKAQLERGSMGGSYFTVQLPDGTYEKRLKMPLNVDPGVHSSLNLEQLASTLQPVATLPTITEQQTADNQTTTTSVLKRKPPQSKRIHRNSETDAATEQPTNKKSMIRNVSQPIFAIRQQGLPKNTSTPTFDRVRKISATEQPTTFEREQQQRVRKISMGDRYKSIKSNLSKASLTSSFIGSTTSGNPEKPSRMVRPLSRKDIFYSGSVTNLPQYHQSQKSLTTYRQSVVSLTKFEKAMRSSQYIDRLAEAEANRENYALCPCCVIPESFRDALVTMLDINLLKDPVFLLIGISNVFGMAGLYVPFVYLVDAAKMNNVNTNAASFLISIIGITNTLGRVFCGYIADFPFINSLLLNNICLIISTVSIAAMPFCYEYWSYVVTSIFFGIAVSGYISLTSIILVDLMGLEKLTNAFGLLILFRGFAAIIGTPLAGAVYDATESYDISFFMASGFFAISAVTSFAAPYMKRFQKPEDNPIAMEYLSPINEEIGTFEEDEENEDDRPIQMKPNLGTTHNES